MATPSGPCLSPWSYSSPLPHNAFSLKKRKTSELQNIHGAAKRRCFPSAEIIPTCTQATLSPGKLNNQGVMLPRQPKTVIDSQPVWCGHDSLLHDTYSESNPVTYQPCPKNSGDFMSHRIPRPRVTEDLDMDLEESMSITARNRGNHHDEAEGNKCSLQKRAEQLQKALQFIKENNISSNDYWAIPSADLMEEELENARIAMETDCVPNADQYRDKTSGNTDQPHFF